jgi:hypothetical protein
MKQELLDQLIATVKKNHHAAKKVKVDQRMAKYIEKYEKLRNIVGFHDEQAWRRYANTRILKRQLLLSTQEKPNVEGLLNELVLARYIQENDVSEDALDKMEAVIAKYLSAYQFLESNGDASKTQARDWFLGIMAVEVEDVLGLLSHEEILMQAMAEELFVQFKFPRHYITPEQQEIFIFIATARVLLRADPELIAYFLIKKRYPAWLEAAPDIAELSEHIWQLKDQIKEYEEHPLFQQLLRLTKKQAIRFWVLDELIKKYKGNLQDLPAKTYTVVKGIYFRLQKRVNRNVWRSFLYLLITKFSLVFILELPYDLWRNGEIHKLQTGINLGVPLFLLLILTIGVQVGNKTNTKMIINEVERLVLGQKTELPTKINLPRERSLARAVIFNLLFMVAYVFSYGAMVYFLWRLHFNWVSAGLFLLFVTLVTYLAMRIRFTAERFRIISRRIRIGREVLYFFAMPVLSSGRWLVNKYTNYNIVLLIFDLLFEAPFKTLVFLFRDFSDFAREKREMIE